MTNRKEPSLRQQMAAALRRLVAEAEAAEAEYDEDDEYVTDVDETVEADKGWEALRTVIRLAKVLYPTRKPRGHPPADNFALAHAAVWLMHLAPKPTGPIDKLMPLARALLDCTEPAVLAVVADIHGNKPNAKSLTDRLRTNRAMLLTHRLYIEWAVKWAKQEGLPTKTLEELAYLEPEEPIDTATRVIEVIQSRPRRDDALRLARLVRDHFDVLPPDIEKATAEVLRQLERFDDPECGDIPPD
jgi:hypothetical protein